MELQFLTKLWSSTFSNFDLHTCTNSLLATPLRQKSLYSSYLLAKCLLHAVDERRQYEMLFGCPASSLEKLKLNFFWQKIGLHFSKNCSASLHSERQCNPANAYTSLQCFYLSVSFQSLSEGLTDCKPDMARATCQQLWFSDASSEFQLSRTSFSLKIEFGISQNWA